MEGHKSGVHCLDFNENTLITGSGDKTIRMWDMQTRECTKVLEGHTSGVCCLQYNNDNKNQLVSGSWDKTIRVWDLTNGVTSPFM
jgi:F-box/WD-40 domain protein MET30